MKTNEETALVFGDYLAMGDFGLKKNRAVILRYYSLDEVLSRQVSWKRFRRAFCCLEKVNEMLYVSELDFWDMLVVVVKDGGIKDMLVFSHYAGVLEDDEEVTIYSEFRETYGACYGKVRISKQDLSVKVEPYDFVSEHKDFDYLEFSHGDDGMA